MTVTRRPLRLRHLIGPGQLRHLSEQPQTGEMLEERIGALTEHVLGDLQGYRVTLLVVLPQRGQVRSGQGRSG